MRRQQSRLAEYALIAAIAVLIAFIVLLVPQPRPASTAIPAVLAALGERETSARTPATVGISAQPELAASSLATAGRAVDLSGATVPATRIGTAMIGGKATWYGAGGLIWAAGPELRRFLGHDWRGSVVVVRSGGRSVTVTLSDWCLCSRRGGVATLIDLSDDAFSRLAPLSAGVIRVSIEARARRVPDPPATDAE